MDVGRERLATIRRMSFARKGAYTAGVKHGTRLPGAEVVDAARQRSASVWPLALLLGALLGLDPSCAHAQTNDVAQAGVEARARALEGRLHAPCCRHLMFEGHASEQTQQLRKEIRARFAQGQSEIEIEAEMRRRYGDTIIAVPLDRDPRPGMSFGLAIAMVGSVALLVMLALRWKRRTRLAAASSTHPQPDGGDGKNDWDARLDRELRELER